MHVQGARIEEQRSELPPITAPTVPDEDFISLIQRFQSNRLEEQRSSLPQLADHVPVSDEIMQRTDTSQPHSH